jgi:Flp pilus assembly protein TadG
MKLSDNQKGAETVEFAIIVPILLLVLFGIMEFGLVLYDKAVITNASREATRSGISYRCPALTTTDITAVVTNATSLNGNSLLYSFASGVTSPQVTVSPDPSTIANCFANSGQPLTVTVTYNYHFLALGGLMSLFVPGFSNPITLSATTVMNYE